MSTAVTEYPMVHCVECNKDQEARYSEPYKSNMVKRSLCFHCLHWMELFDAINDPKYVRVKGVHYAIGNESEQGLNRWRGFGGARFKIHFFDGREIASTNLWCQGHIPEHFKGRLPDNAEFVKDLAD